jgi:hypothetical protein
VKINLSPTYISDASSARRQPIVLDVALDPSTNSITAPFKLSRQNGYVVPATNGKSLLGAMSGLQNTVYLAAGDPGQQQPGWSSPTPTPGEPPLKVANLTAAWDGDDIKLTFDFDTTDTANRFFDRLSIGLSTDGGTTYSILTPSIPYDVKILSTTSTSQTIKISTNDQTTTGLYNTIGFNSVEVATYDSLNQTDGFVKASLADYVVTLSAPIITSENATSSYKITTTNLDAVKTSTSFLSEIIQEFELETTGLTDAQVDTVVAASISNGLGGWVTVGEPKTVSPTTVFAPNGLHRYVRAWYMTTKGGKSAYSNYVEATPGALLPANNLPPANATDVSAAFSNSGAGDDIIVSYTLPTIVDADVNKPVTVKVKLTPTSENTRVGFFYHTIANNSESSFTIPANSIFSQFGKYYTSYTGTFVLQSQYGTESSSVQNINSFSRTNSISSVVPAATVTNVIDGYNVQFALGTSGADHGEVYQFFINPSFYDSDMPDYMDGQFTSGGTSGQKTLVVQSLSMENGAFTPPSGKTVNDYIGYGITGVGVPDNTWVTSITGSGPYTLTLNNNLTTQASGNYHIQSLVYAGGGPANIFENYYSSIYIVLRYYDIYGNNSQNSQVYTVNPINPTTSIISNAIQVGSGGAIYVGDSATTGSRIVLGPSKKAPDGSQYSGIFAFDYGSVAGTAASTSIITNPSAIGYTFETVSAKIADWTVKDTYIQNALSGGASNYVGMSATGTYSFWAGSTSSGGDSSAKFSVTPGGAVIARSISIYGDGTNSTSLAIGGTPTAAPFRVNSTGDMVASSATITGSITVSQASNFNSSVTIGSSGYLIVGATNTANVKIGSAGITASPDGTTTTTQISSSPIGSDNVTLATTAAYLGSLTGASGAWIVKAGKIYSGQIELDSTNGYITAYPTDYNANQKNYGVRIYGGSSTTNGYAISVGALSGTPNFYVDHTGKVTATNATISGTVTASSFTIDANNYWNDGTHTGDFRIGSSTNYLLYTNSTLKLQNSNIISGKTTLDSTTSGYYIGADGKFNLGSSNNYIKFDGTIITLNSGTTTYAASDSTTAYYHNAQIILNSGNNGLQIYGLPQQGSNQKYFIDPNVNNLSDPTNIGSMSLLTEGIPSDATTYYAGVKGLGSLPRQRMIVEDPISGQLKAGIAVYYQDLTSSAHGSTNPVSSGATTGAVGDLWVSF